jgi:RNA polymerase sigma-70 factor (ECF subfamily)
MKYETEAIWTKFSPQLKYFILKRVSDESIADDILQEVFKKNHLHIGTLIDDTKVERWIYQITRNTIIDHYRTQKIEEDIPQDIPVSEILRGEIYV